MNIKIKGLEETIKFYGSLNQNAKAAMKIEITDMANKVKSEMQADAPVDVARLKNAISYEQADLKVTFAAKTFYAPYMEFGTKKKVHVPSWVGSDYAAKYKGPAPVQTDSKKAIAQWASKKGVQDWKAVWWHIMKNGVKPHPFFFTTKNGQNRLQIIKERYIAALKQGLKNIQP
jgi:HK97 gp10 family phage protein